MNRITEDTMRIEHFESQSTTHQKELEYTNMLGCCKGNEGSPHCKTHCDIHKKDETIKYNPADPNVWAKL